MATTSYEIALRMAESLNREEQLRLIEELKTRAGAETSLHTKVSVFQLFGLGAEIWREEDAQEYVDRERSSWNG